MEKKPWRKKSRGRPFSRTIKNTERPKHVGRRLPLARKEVDFGGGERGQGCRLGGWKISGARKGSKGVPSVGGVRSSG